VDSGSTALAWAARAANTARLLAVLAACKNGAAEDMTTPANNPTPPRQQRKLKGRAVVVIRIAEPYTYPRRYTNWCPHVPTCACIC